MDRFIALQVQFPFHRWRHLKSNMDRFIVKAVILTQIAIMYLKSNMDRFIVNKHPELNTTDQI